MSNLKAGIMETFRYPSAVKKIAYLFLIMLMSSSLAFFQGCAKEDGPSTERVADIVGTWTATSTSFNGVDVVAEGGGATFVIQANARFTFTIRRPGRADMVFTGNLGFDEEWLAVEYDNYPGEYEYYNISYTATTMDIGANSEFDFDGDGTDEFVVFFLYMER